MLKTEQEYREDIRKALYMHGSISLLFYQMGDEWIVKKWGQHELVERQLETLFKKYMNAGLTEEAESLTLLELPPDEDLIYRILHCGSLKKTLEEYFKRHPLHQSNGDV